PPLQERVAAFWYAAAHRRRSMGHLRCRPADDRRRADRVGHPTDCRPARAHDVAPGANAPGRARLERISQPPQQNHDAAEFDEGEEVLRFCLETRDEAARALKPREQSLNVPATF